MPLSDDLKVSSDSDAWALPTDPPDDDEPIWWPEPGTEPHEGRS